MKKVTTPSLRACLYGVFVLYLFVMAFWIDNSLAYQPKPKAKKVCCKSKPCLPKPKQQKKCPPACPCPCNAPTQNAPLQVILSNDNIVAYQEIKEASKDFLKEKSFDAHLAYQAVDLPSLPLPAQTGKDHLKRLGVWRT